jgi:hypothetical protein
MTKGRRSVAFKDAAERLVIDMSEGSNELSSEQVFRERKKYRDVVFPDGMIDNMCDTWGKDRFYGKINPQGNAVLPMGRRLKPLRYTTRGRNFLALNFVANAWRDLAERLRELSDTGVLFESSPWASPEIYKAYESTNYDYDEYVKDAVFPVFTEVFMDGEKNSKLRDFDSFMDLFSEYYKDIVLRAGVLTRSGYVESAMASPMCSGLVIELGNDSYDDDFMKIEKYGDLNFNVVASIASQYGFLIDRNVPWRLVADLSSKAMQEYMIGVPIVGIEGDFLNQLDKCRDIMRNNPSYVPDFFGYSQIPGFEDVRRHIHAYINEDGDLEPGYPSYYPIKNASTQQEIAAVVFSKAFEETWKTDMDYLAPYFLKIYNSYVGAYPIMSIYLPGNPSDPVCPLGKQITIQREPITTQTIAGASSRYGDRWSYKTFYNIRTEERRKGYSITQDGVNLRDATNIYDFRTGDSDSRYIATLRFIQNNFLGPLIDKFLNIRTVGDILS